MSTEATIGDKIVEALSSNGALSNNNNNKKLGCLLFSTGSLGSGQEFKE